MSEIGDFKNMVGALVGAQDKATTASASGELDEALVCYVRAIQEATVPDNERVRLARQEIIDLFRRAPAPSHNAAPLEEAVRGALAESNRGTSGRLILDCNAEQTLRAALTQQSAAHAVKIKCVKCEGRGKHAEWSSAGAVVNVACACCGGNGLAAQAAHAGAAEKPLAHGHREDYYLMANARILAEKPIHAVRTMPNWVLASELFATGSNSAHQICGDAGIDPDGYKVVRAALAATEKKEQK